MIRASSSEHNETKEAMSNDPDLLQTMTMDTTETETVMASTAADAVIEAKFPRTISVEEIISNKKARVDSVSPSLSSSPSPLSSSSSSCLPTTTTTSKQHPQTTSPFQSKNYTNLLSEKTSSVLFATDEWFARAENLIKDSEPVFIPDLYCPEGKVMDGWESRRRRTEGHDWCVIAIEGREKGKINDIAGIEIDTAYFTGNQSPRISIEVANCYSDDDDSDDNNNNEEWMYKWMPGALKRLIKGGGVQGTGQSPSQVNNAKKACEQFEWKEVLPMTPLKPGYEESRMHYFVLDEKTRELAKGFTHVRVNYFPDGGVARLRLWGFSQSDINTNAALNSSIEGLTNEDINVVPSSIPYHHPELSLSTNGGVGLICSNKHYGVPANLIKPTYGKDMGDGWETARHPDRPPILIKNPLTNLIDNPLMDWAVLKLGMGGALEHEGINRIIIDTKHFKGNFPESVMVEGCDANITQASDEDVCNATPDKNNGKIEWFPLLKRTQMGPDREHVFDKEKEQLMNSCRAVTHIRVRIYPDGGISRVRVYGQSVDEKDENTDSFVAHLI